MEYMGHQLTDNFDYVCKAKDGTVDEFTIFANVVGEKDGKVELDRFQRFGELHLEPTTITRESFEEYYEKTAPAEPKREKNNIER